MESWVLMKTLKSGMDYEYSGVAQAPAVEELLKC